MQWIWKKIFSNKKIPRKLQLPLNAQQKRASEKAGPFQSAMSMINFYENRAGKNLPASQKKLLDASKNELRKSYGREEE